MLTVQVYLIGKSLLANVNFTFPFTSILHLLFLVLFLFHFHFTTQHQILTGGINAVFAAASPVRLYREKQCSPGRPKSFTMPKNKINLNSLPLGDLPDGGLIILSGDKVTIKDRVIIYETVENGKVCAFCISMLES